MVTFLNVTMRNKSISLHPVSTIMLTSLPFLSKLSFLGAIEDTRTVLFSC